MAIRLNERRHFAHHRKQSAQSFVDSNRRQRKCANESRKTPGTPIWQRNYYEHIVRDEDDPYRIRMYIRDNPLKWAVDEENPKSAR